MAEIGEEYQICKTFFFLILGNQEIPITFEYKFKMYIFLNTFIDLWSS